MKALWPRLKASYLAIGAVVVVTWLGVGLLPWVIFSRPSDSAHLGDSFGFINSLFSAAALVGAILAIVLQGKELEAQRDELRESKKISFLSQLLKVAEEYQDLSDGMRDDPDSRFRYDIYKMFAQSMREYVLAYCISNHKEVLSDQELPEAIEQIAVFERVLRLRRRLRAPLKEIEKIRRSLEDGGHTNQSRDEARRGIEELESLLGRFLREGKDVLLAIQEQEEIKILLERLDAKTSRQSALAEEVVGHCESKLQEFKARHSDL